MGPDRFCRLLQQINTTRREAGSMKGIGSNMSAPKGDYPLGAKGLGKDVYPFGLPKQEVRKAYEAVKRGGNYIIEGKDFASTIETKDTFSTVDSLLVAQQAPGIVPEYFEARLIDHLPVTAITAPSYQFLQHNFASDSGGPGFVAEGATKPQWNPAAEKVVVTPQKIAGYFNISSESMMDAPQWESYLINTLFRLIMKVENTAILYGTVTSSLGIQGWSTQSGILTHDASADGGSATNLDSLELAINHLRVQSGVYATPNLAIMSPTTWCGNPPSQVHDWSLHCGRPAAVKLSPQFGACRSLLRPRRMMGTASSWTP